MGGGRGEGGLRLPVSLVASFVIRVLYIRECTGLTFFFSRSAVVCNRSAAVMKNHVPGITLTREGSDKCAKPRIRFVWKKWLKFRKVSCKVAAP